MADKDGYSLLDAGDGRRLERFGDRLVDRPAPAALEPIRSPAAWRDADLRYERLTGWAGPAVDPWTVELGGLTFELRPTEAGQVGIFPDHARFWPWLETVMRDVPGTEVLHLFAHTGGSTLALARAGARVAHVDASRPAVAWARRNAELSGLRDTPVRWLVDDAEAFVAREARRGRRYAGIVLDPPTYGHGAGNRAWRIETGLPGLLERCADLLEPAGFMLLTAHSAGWGPQQLADLVTATFRTDALEAEDIELTAESGARLPLGAVARVIIAR